MSMSAYFHEVSMDFKEKHRSHSRSPHRKNIGYSRKYFQDYDSDNEHGRRDSDSYWDHRHGRASKSRSRERDRYHRDRDYDSHKDRDHTRNFRSNSRWERKSEERKVRDRDRCHREDDEDNVDSERSLPNGVVIGASGSEIIGYKSQPPNNTIMIRGLAQHITENDVRQDIIQCGLMPKDIRLIRKKDTGASRGFAFVEFSSLGEATRWMDLKQGILMVQDQYRAIMQYSIPKEQCQNSEKPVAHKASSDWFCIKCGAQNFKRRDNCFKCYASRMESEVGGSGSDEICNYVTKTIMLRNLDALTMEDSVMQVLTQVIPDIIKKVSGVCIGRDPLTSTSRGICYLGTESTVDALALYGALISLSPPLNIDGKTVIVSYCKYNMGDTKKAHEHALTAAFPNANQPSIYSLNDVDSLADYSASRYAKSVTEYQQYFEYYKNYFTQQINAGNSITLQDNQMDAANAAAAVAQSAIQQVHAQKSYYETGATAMPNGTDGKHYPVPDISKFTIEKNTGYQYDVTTGLYYDPHSTYYWNNIIQKYLYYDQEKLTYLLAPASSYEYKDAHFQMLHQKHLQLQPQSPVEIQTESGPKKQKNEKPDKVKVAKKIAKDMERWAKTLNQKRDSSACRTNVENNINSIGSIGSADIGYSVLEKKNSISSLLNSMNTLESDIPPNISQSVPLVASYGDSESSEEEVIIDESEFLDFSKLICNLCKRQLISPEALTKHAKLSDLHKKNLDMIKVNSQKSDIIGGKITYRDRAKERRMKYRDTDEPQPSKLKEKYLKSKEYTEIPIIPVPSISEPISSENVGNKLLQKMGWTEGQGLGKTNQGRTTIIQAEQRNSTVGLGSKFAYTATAGESYKDCVKKMMFARYQELSDKI